MSEAKVLISGPIVGDSSEAGDAWPYTTLEDVLSQLEWQRPYDSVRVLINSPGGRLDKGLGIYDKLRTLGPDITVTTEAIGQCSSIATIVFLAGSTRLIHEHTECLIHLPRGGCEGATPAQAQQWADDMLAAQQKMIDISVERTGQAAEVIAARMAEEKNVSPSDMLALGFATLVLKPVTALATLPILAASPASSTDDTPSWAQTLMSKFTAALAAMTLAVAGANKPVTALAPTATDTSSATTALAVESDKGQLTIETGDRTTYEVGDKVTAPDSPSDPVADGDYVLTDGHTITVTAELISAIVPTVEATASAEQDETMGQVLAAITNLANEVKGIKQTVAATTAATNNRLNTIAAATGSTGIVEPDSVITASQQGKNTTIATGQSAADRRAEKQKQTRRL
ncbi:ATP-dependent Clp protease proteolytic subunit [Hymenobacter metallicola]|uniref:ATP-dependent Clp protease proteolytic subunit n=1 Tax=Hymenobacter metallicola TaxID=2563114 RepID=A0A4Z0QJP2_9BACT|nr:ATP-dependent Clp protease proteolytic subunit [Hymenobacter metallicola]TGE29736.1 hypothetical protein E5K02_09835 [Hymenobacter metallicola]